MDDELLARRFRSLTLFRVAMVLTFLALIAQLFRLQVIQHEQLSGQSELNRQRAKIVTYDRGVIYDRNGVQLVRNVPSFTVSIVRADLPDPADRVYQELGRLLDLPADAIRASILERERLFDAWTPMPIKRGVDTAPIAYIKERPDFFRGVQIGVDSVREYDRGPVFSHILGYVGPISEEKWRESQKSYPELRYNPADRVGQTGIEELFEERLRGKPGEERFSVRSSGQVIDYELRVLTPGEPATNIVLTIDSRLQSQVHDILAKHIDRYGTASAIVMDVKNATVLAMVDLPSYDNNMFSREVRAEELTPLLDDPRRPLLNKAIGGAYAPGSVFKIITALAGLQEQIIFPTTTVECNGKIFIESEVQRGRGEELHDWTLDGHGKQDVVAALGNSCDIFFYLVAGGQDKLWDGVGNVKLAQYARLFGLGRPTGLGLQGEAPGLAPDERWKERALPHEPWLKGNTFTYGIGQSYLQTTPIQMLNALVTVLNNGVAKRPRIIAEWRDGDGRVVKTETTQTLDELPIDKRWFELVKRGLVAGMQPDGVTENGAQFTGTSYDSAVADARFAGKTGTAETGRGKQTHGWFAGYAPAENPEIALIVFVENGSGSYNAAVRAEKIVRAYFGLPDTPHDDTFK